MSEPIETLARAVERRAVEAPDHPLLTIANRTSTYGEMDLTSRRVATALRRDGLGAGDAIAVLAGDSATYLALMIGTARVGVVLAAIPVSAQPSGQDAMIRDSGARILFADRPIEMSDPIPTVRIEEGFEEWLGTVEPAADHAGIDPDDPMTIIYSSGTTGTPKGIVQPFRYRALMMGGGPSRGYTGDAVTLLATPLYSNTTLSSLTQSIAVGASIVLMEKFDAGKWLALAERHRATHAMLVPVICQRLLAHEDFDATDLSSFRMKYCTSAPFSQKLKREMLVRFPGGLIEFYGMTEGGASFILRAHDHPDKLHTVGTVGPGGEVRVLDEQDRDVPQGEQGEIVTRSPAMMVGYRNRPEETAASRWVDPEGMVWQRTGDIGRIDEDGFLTIVDRKKDMIISGGFNIYPSDIEAVLAGHAQVSDVSVVGVASEEWGETPVAFVVAPGQDPGALKQWVNERVGKTQRVADVCLIDTLPRNSIGKVLKRDLQDRYEGSRNP